MVDSISSVGASALNSARSQGASGVSNERGEERSQQIGARSDRVDISEEALDLAQAEAAARDVARAVQEDETQTLGLDPSFDEAA